MQPPLLLLLLVLLLQLQLLLLLLLLQLLLSACSIPGIPECTVYSDACRHWYLVFYSCLPCYYCGYSDLVT